MNVPENRLRSVLLCAALLCATLLCAGVLAGIEGPAAEAEFRRGDADGSAEIDITDAVVTLGWLFLGGAEPPCLDAADTNDDDSIDITDATYTLTFLFTGGAVPPAPHPGCGVDPSPDGLGCAQPPACGPLVDSDENGIPDTVELGPDPTLPLDTDGDRIPDHLDRDDDGDGLLDVHDPDRLLSLQPSDPLGPDPRPALFSARGDNGPEAHAPGLVRVGEVLILDGRGFAAEPEGNWVLFAGDGVSLNARPTSASAEELRVTVPEGARSPVAVVAGGRRSGDLPVEIRPAGSPILFAPPLGGALGERTTVLRGRGLAGVTEVRLGDIPRAPVRVDEGSVELQLFFGESSGPIRVRAGESESNICHFRVVRDIAARVVLPPQFARPMSDISISTGLGDAVRPAANGNATVSAVVGPLELVVASLPPGDGARPVPVALALLTSNGSRVQLDAPTTATTLVVLSDEAVARGDANAIDELHRRLPGLSEVRQLADEIAAGLLRDPAYLASPGPEFVAAFAAAVRAAAPFLRASPAAPQGGGIPAPPVGTQGLAEFRPGADQFDIRMKQIEGTGNVRLENDTMLFLSVRAEDLDRGFLFQDHVHGYLDPKMVGPQGGLTQVFWSSDQDYVFPNYHSSHLEIATAGFGLPRVERSEARDAQFILRLRTFIDRVILPLVSSAAGLITDSKVKSGQLSELSSAIINSLTYDAPDMLQAVRNQWAGDGDGRVQEGMKTLVTFLKNDVFEIGPVTTAIVKSLRGVADAALVRAFGIRVAERLLPGIGTVENLLTIADLVDTGTNVAKTVYDLLGTPGQVDFEVDFGIAIVEVSPTILERSPAPAIVAVKGFRLATAPNPVITLFDEGNGLFREVNTADRTAVRIVESRTEGPLDWLVLELDGAYLSEVEGPLRVEASRDNERVRARDLLSVRGELELMRISPDHGQDGVEVTLEGRGFRTDTGANVSVIFTDALAEHAVDPLRVKAEVLSVAAEKIAARTPPRGEASGVWRVHVEQGSTTRRVRSNTMAFYVTLPPPLGYYHLRRVTTDLGQNLEPCYFGSFVLLPNGKVVLLSSHFVGMWSLSGNQLQITACDPSPRRPFGFGWFVEFEGTLSLSGGPFPVRCADQNARGGDCATLDSPALEGTCRSYYDDHTLGGEFLGRRFFSAEFDNRFVWPESNVASRDGFIPLGAGTSANCAGECGQRLTNLLAPDCGPRD